jgi:ADP-ribose pyrophosphatase YjhB (NUDIX family)
MNEKHLSAHIGQYGLIKNSENKILLLERKRSKTWCLPGGRINVGEDWEIALLREIKEEIGLECYDPKPFSVNILKDNYQTKYCVYFTVQHNNLNNLRVSNEHSSLGWFNQYGILTLNIEDEKVKKVVLSYINN